MFDYDAHAKEQAFQKGQGRNPDQGLYVTFSHEEWRGNTVPFIHIFLTKNEIVDRPVTEEDKLRFKDRWEAFLAGEDTPPEGMPINTVPFATKANISQCKSERIFTVEQLIASADRPHLTAFKYQCVDMMKQLKDSQHIVAMREEMDALKSQLAALSEQNTELKSEIREEPTPVKKKRGRPRKSSGDTQGNNRPNPA